MFRGKKIYGSYREDKCPFCEKRALIKNKQKVPVCLDHKDRLVQDYKCVCGNFLELKEGRFGPYFHCISCGNKNFQKVLDGDFK